MAGIRQHRAGEIVRQGLQVPSGADVGFQQSQECTDRRIFVFELGACDDDFAAAQLECHLAAGIDTQRLPDRLGEGDLPLGRECGELVDAGHGCAPVFDPHASMVRKFPYLVNPGILWGVVLHKLCSIPLQKGPS